MIRKYSPITLFSFFMFFLFVQMAPPQGQEIPWSKVDYTNEWSAVKDLENSGKPRSALEKVEDIYTHAVAQQLDPQKVKAIIYKLKLWSQFEEDSQIMGINYLKKEIDRCAPPTKNILQSLQAEMIWNYYQSNRYKILDRDVLAQDNNQDIRTWDYSRFADATNTLYLQSIAYEESKNCEIEQWEDILLEGTDRNLRPTLYDFLAFRALNHFNNDESNLNPSSSVVSFDNPQWLGDYRHFILLPVDTTQVNPRKSYISIMQDLIRFHEADTDPQALIDADLIRLKYVYNKANFSTADSLYSLQLNKWFLDPKKSSLSADAGFLAAQLIYTQASNKLDTDLDCLYCQAFKMCNSVIQRFPKTEAATNCNALLDKINQKFLEVKIAEVSPQNEAVLALLTIRNVDEAFFKVVKIPFTEHNFFKPNYRNDKDRLINLRNMEEVANWSYELHTPKDYDFHKMEIAVPVLKSGYYALITSNSKSFTNEDVTSYCTFQISNLSLSNSYSAKNELVVLNRNNGSPVANAKVSVYRSEYKKGVILVSENKTGSNGKIEIPDSQKSYGNSFVTIEKDDDLLISNLYSSQFIKSPKRISTRIHFFTDREVYRPGQTIYFKGLAIENNSAGVKILTNYNVPVELRDLNNQIRKEATYVTNEYGSFHGSFTIPNDIATGIIRITSTFGNKLVRVEEYKRPAFEITFQDPYPRKNSTKPFEVTGNTLTYSGIPVDNATIRYRVIQKEYYPWRWYYQKQVEVEVATGEMRSDENGRFVISFFPAEQKKKNSYFYGYRYEVTVIATDINGETHENSTTITDAIKSYTIDNDFPAELDLQTGLTLKAQVIDHLSEVVSTRGKVQVFRLVAPEKVYRKRLWQETPDISIIPEKEFVTLFPNDYFSKPAEVSDWKTGKMVLEQSFSRGKLDFNTKEWSKWQPGMYRFVFSAVSPEGDSIQKQVEILIFDSKSDKNPIPAIFNVTPINVDCEVGDTASLLVGSSKQNMDVYYYLTRDGAILDRKIITLNNNQKRIDIPIKEEYRGNVFVSLFTVCDNREYANKQTINVPFSNKKLDVEFITFRDKIEPGKKEQWKLKIKNVDGNPVDAEVLATLYDRSLDALDVLDYSLSLYPNASLRFNINRYGFTLSNDNYIPYYYGSYYGLKDVERNYDQLLWSPQGYYGGNRAVMAVSSKRMPAVQDESANMLYIVEDDVDMEFDAIENVEEESSTVKPEIRKDFRETGFFFPQMHTDKEGNVLITFTAPEAITGWKLLGVAHTKALQTAIFSNETVTQKELMITPNMPRFVRSGDHLILSANIQSMQKKTLQVEASLELFDPYTGKIIRDLIDGFSRMVVVVEPSGNVAVSWDVTIPEQLSSLGFRITAKGDQHTDGEEHVIPVLPSKTLVTESLPIHINKKGKHSFSFTNLLESSKHRTTENYSVTMEYTPNPAWYAVQALPYLEENQYKSADALFNRYYANTLASYIANYNPDIKRIFDLWRTQNPEALLSNLQKNTELKNILLQESPWLLQARNEEEQKQRMALLFDLNRISEMKTETWNTLIKLQQSDGGWSWFNGMYSSRFITLNIVQNSARLYFLGVENSIPDEIQLGAEYLDKEAEKMYEEMKKQKGFDPEKNHLSPYIISWIYARSLLGDRISTGDDLPWYRFYMDQMKSHWTEMGLYQQAQIAISLYFNVEPELAVGIIESLKERALYSEELGMYWRDLTPSYFWYNAPIETMASLIEAFSLINNDEESVELMKIWLLKQKQTNSWPSSIATVHAIYALLLQGDDLLQPAEEVSITLGTKAINMEQSETEPGTGYIKKVWTAAEVTADMGNITINTSDDQLSWGAVYWQYYQAYDELQQKGNGLAIWRKLYKETATPQGPQLQEITARNPAKMGDKIVVRLVVESDRDMSFVHLKDQRSAAYEPVVVVSGYRYDNGLGYYESIRDASVNFFFNELPKGVHVFEYELFKVREGIYHGGLATIQCLYAPEFTAHSSGD